MAGIDPDGINSGDELGHALAELYRRGGWSYHRLAEASGLSPATVLAIVNGTTGIPRTATLTAYVEACGERAAPWVAARGRAVQADRRRRPAVMYVPGRTETFVGRAEDLARLDEALAEPGGTVVRAVHGLGGIGKSTLAAQYALTRAGRYELVWWIHADSPARIEAGLAALAAALEPTGAQGTLEELAGLAVRWLTGHDRWLLVLDNVTDPEHVAELLARAPAGRFLITSRLGTGWHRVTTSAVRLDVLSHGESADLLTRIATLDRPGADLDGRDELCAWLGGLPLAVEQAGAFIHQNQLTPRAYLELLLDHPAAMYDQPPHGFDPERTIARIWRVTLDRLGDIPLTGRLLRILAWWAPQDIPRTLLDGLAGAPEVERALGGLAAYNMITLRPGTIAVHRLVQAVTRTPDPADPHRQPADVDEARDLATSLLLLCCPGDYDGPESWPAWRTLLPHIDALAEWTPPEADTHTGQQLFNLTQLFLESQGAIGRATRYAERCLEAARRLWGDDDPETFTAMANVALAYKAAGDLGRAIPLYEQALAGQERFFGEDHPAPLTSRNNLAGAFMSAHDPERAIPLFERVADGLARQLGDDDPLTLKVRANLADAYDMAGDVDRALPLYERTLADRVRTLGPDHPDTLVSRNGLACVYDSVNDLTRAIPLYEQTLADFSRVLGDDHPDTFRCANNLAHAYVSAGDVGRAIELYERTLAGQERVLGADHPDVLLSVSNLGCAYEAAGDLERAVALLERAVADHERVFGADQFHTVANLMKLSEAYAAAGDMPRAVAASERLYADCVRVFGPDDVRTLTAGNNLAELYRETGESRRAVILQRKILARRQRVLGPSHEDTLISRNNLACSVGEAGDAVQALELFARAYTECVRALGPDHPQTATTRQNLANAYAHVRSLLRMTEKGPPWLGGPL